MDPIGTSPILLSPLTASPESLGGEAGVRDGRSIEKVATEFEGVFMSLLLKEMRQTLEPGTLFGGEASDSYGGLFDLYLGKHLANAGKLGIADMVQRYLEARKTDASKTDCQL